MDFNIPEDIRMIQALAREFVQEQLIPLEKEVLGRESDMVGAQRNLSPEREAELMKMVQEIGLWGLNIPEQLGGAGLSVLGTCIVEEELANDCICLSISGNVTPYLFDWQ